MNKIISKERFSEKVFKLEIEAPLIAKSRKAGHFVIVRVGDKGERMPLTIAGSDLKKGTITLVIQEVGLSSTRLCELNEGDYITDVVGPLGQATHIENFGTVVCAGGGVGVAPMLPIVQALKAAGNRVITVLAGRNKDLIILEKEMRESSDEVIIMTDDGSYGRKGLVTEGVEEVIKREKVDKCFAIGPAIMMKFVCLLTKKYEIPTDVSLNTIMVDGTGMCGACRITVGGKTKFVCVDGPEFDGHQVDFDEMLKRMGAFKKIEREEMNKLQPECEATKEIDEKSRNAAWRQELRKSMKPKERTAIPRVEMNELDAEYRSHSRKEEVNQGLTAEQAVTEAKRCLDCANPGCMEGCPVGIDIPRFIKNIERGEFLEAAKTLKETSALPAVCGRVCPRNAIRTAEPLRTGSGLESRDNGKYGCPGHKGRVMNMRWGRFGSINICLLIDWCNEPTKKIPLGAGRLSFGRFGKTGIPSGGRPLRTSGPELPVVSRWDSKFLCCSMIRVENTLPENALGRRNRLYGRKTG